jgi:hypothetical protein
MVAAILTLVGFLELLAMGYGALSIFAGSMSDDPYGGQAAAYQGAVFGVVGLIVLIVVIVVAFWRGFW